MTDLYHNWRNALETKTPVEFVAGKPGAGFYRVRDRNADRSIRWDGVAIWYEDGEPRCIRTGPRPAPTHIDDIDALFASCNAAPITYELYQHVAGGGAWPEAIEPVAFPALPLDEALTAEIDALREQAAGWLAGIKSVSTQEHADKAANFSEAFAKLEKKATETHKAEKAPFLEGGRVVDARWKPIAERAASLKTWAKKTIEPFLIAERQRLAAEEAARRAEADRIEREARAAREAAEKAGAPPPAEVVSAPIFAPPPTKAGAGTFGRKVALRKRTIYRVVDLRAFLIFLSDRNDISDEFREAAMNEGERLTKSGVTPAGVEKEEIEVAS